MNLHRRFAHGSARPRGATHSALALVLCAAAALLPSCQHPGDRLLSLSDSVPPKLAGDKPFIHVQCYFFTAPDDFQLLENTKGAHVAGFYSPQDGDKLVESLQRRRGFKLTSAPTLTMRQGQGGTIEVTREFIYPTEYDAPQIPKDLDKTWSPENPGIFPVTPAAPTKFETRNLGITAKFEARTNSRGELGVKMDLARSTFLGFVNYGTPIKTSATSAFGKPVEVVLAENNILMPVFTTARLATTVTLADRHYLAIGGLKADSQPNLQARIQSPAGLEFEPEANLFVLVKLTAGSPTNR